MIKVNIDYLLGSNEDNEEIIEDSAEPKIIKDLNVNNSIYNKGINRDVDLSVTSDKIDILISYLYDDKQIKELNENPACSAIMVTRPLFKGAREEYILSFISPLKDVGTSLALSILKTTIRFSLIISSKKSNFILGLKFLFKKF